MRLTISPRTGAAYVYVIDPIPDGGVDHSVEVGDDRVIDYDAKGAILGYEFLSVREGVDLAQLPHRDELVRVFADHGVRILV